MGIEREIQESVVKNHPVLLYDGVCNLCNSTVQFVIARDKKAKIRFAALQSEFGQVQCEKAGLPKEDLQSLILIEDGKLYTRSSGALRLFKNLGGIWALSYAFIIVPKFIRDGVYNFIAKNRYKWFGEQESCLMPTPDIEARFLDV